MLWVLAPHEHDTNGRGAAEAKCSSRMHALVVFNHPIESAGSNGARRGHEMGNVPKTRCPGRWERAQKNPQKCRFSDGGYGWTRTTDLGIMSATL